MRRLIVGFVVMLVVGGGAWLALAQEGGAQARIPLVTGLDLFQRAQQSLEAGDFEQAVMDTSLFILLNPTFAPGYYLRAVSYAQLNDFDAALTDISAALTYPAPSADFTAGVYRLRATIHIQLEDTDAALTDISAALEVTPADTDLLTLRASLLLSEERYEEALPDLNVLIELDPETLDNYINRALVNLELGDLDAAVADFNALIERDPRNTEAYFRRAQIYIEQENFEAALADLDTVLGLGVTDPAVFLARGQVNTHLGNSADATLDYFEYVRRQTSTQEVHPDPLIPGESLVIQVEQGLAYIVTFRARAGEVVTLRAEARPGDSAADPLVVLLDTEARPLAADDDSAGDMNAIIRDYVIPADGVYGLLVTHAAGGSDGPVRILWELGR